MRMIELKSRQTSNSSCTILYSININNKTFNVASDIEVRNNEWDSKKLKIVKNVAREMRSNELSIYEDRIRVEKQIIKHLLSSVKIHNINKTIMSMRKNRCSFIYISLEQCGNLRLLEKHRTAETYLSFLVSFIKFRCGYDISIDKIDENSILLYELSLKKQNLLPNTISFYMRRFRAIYVKMVGEYKARAIFHKSYTTSEKTIKRAISIADIKKIRNIDLSHNVQLDFARDIFMFSFYTRGMSFVDIAYLTNGNVRNSYLTYVRRKTGQKMMVKWERCMQEIVDKHTNEGDSHLLPIITMPYKDHRYQYIYSLSRVNKALKEIAQLLNISSQLTMYVARHSWATAAKTSMIPIAVISEAMGHKSQTTTQVYLASLEFSIIDEANKSILSMI